MTRLFTQQRTGEPSGHIMPVKKVKFLLAIFTILCFTQLHAQPTFKVGGTLKDVNNEPLIGVTVVEKGTDNGTITDINGEFSLDVAAQTVTLVASYIGYKSQEVSATAGQAVSITLVAGTELLDEVVVVGYGTQKKKDLTGSISSINSKAIENQPAASVDKLLQGRAAGVQISQSSGAPGGRATIRIRGASSINAGNEPLLVIDGIPVYNSGKDPGGTSYGTFSATNALASLNPNDIASVEVLKDASATAIYGSRGSNGVILITTKRGNSQSAKIEYNGYYGIQKISNRLDLMNGQEHAEFLNDWAVANKLPAPYANPAAIGEGTDWQNEIFRSAPIQDHQLSLTGGSNNTKFFVSANYFNQEGITLNTGLSRYAVRLNVDQRVNDKTRISQSLTYNRTVNQSVPISNAGSDNVRSAGERAYTSSPAGTVFDETGAYSTFWYGLNKPENPVWSLLTTQSNLEGDNLLGNITLDHDIVKGLTFRTMLGVNLLNRSNTEYYPGASTYIGGLFGGLGAISNRRITNILNENTLRYSKLINDKHSFEALGGFTWQKETNFFSSAQATTFPSDVLNINSISGATGTPQLDSNLSDWSIASLLGRVNYQYDDKLLITATVRADGSSRFAQGKKWGYFPSVAVGYRLSEESFIKDLNVFDNLKLRASYGLTGNQEIGNYQSLPRLTTDLIYIFDNTLVSGSRQTSLANTNLTWEKSAGWDIGLDMDFWDSRLRLVFDVYRKVTNDLLFTINLPAYSGFGSALYNTGSLDNKGVELTAGADIFKGKFNWTIDGNISTNKQEMLSLGQSGSSTLFVGYAPGVSLSYMYDGVFHNQAEIDAQTAQQGVVPGDIRYVDSNGDGVFDANDRVLVGKPNPDYMFGLNNEFSYGDLTLSFFFQGVMGEDANRLSRLFDPNDASSNKARTLVDRWTPENPNSDIPRAGAKNWLTSSYLRQDISFIKLRNIKLGYNVPLGSKTGVRNCQIYVSGQNLLTVTDKDYFGYDPDGSSGYPNSSVMMVGLNLGF